MLPTDFTLVGVIQKPYGLLGEIKVRPETFDLGRYKDLKRVFARDRVGEITALDIRAARDDGQFWYLKFEGYRTPEAASALSGQELLIDAAERLELPEGMVYFSDIPGMRAVDERGETVGELVEVRETGAVEYLVIRTPKGEVQVPWSEPFVRGVDKTARVVNFDLSTLRGVIL